MSDRNHTTASILESLREPDINWKGVLMDIITHFDCKTGTLHLLDDDNLLQLKAEYGIPEFLIPKLSTIPIGKGMAGIAAERQIPVEMCNLQTDNSGVARPAAKETKVEGSIAVPMMQDGHLYGVYGIAKPIPYDFTEQEKNDLKSIGEAMSKALKAAERS
ncbi:MAG: GAF domain-containing protein [Leeuwenhoekiella sp.]